MRWVVAVCCPEIQISLDPYARMSGNEKNVIQYVAFFEKGKKELLMSRGTLVSFEYKKQNMRWWQNWNFDIWVHNF